MLNWLPELLIAAAAAAVVLKLPIASAPAAWLLIFWAPGSQALRWLGIAPRRSGSWALLAVGLSLAVSPVILYWAGLVWGFRSLPLALSLAGVSIGLGIAARLWLAARQADAGQLFETRRYRRIFTAVLAVLAMMLLIPLVQVRTQAGLYLPGVSDWAKHYAISWLIETTGLAPQHLLYPPWREQPFVYYYFFHLLVAAQRLMSGGSLSTLAAYTATTLGVCLTFVGLIALLARRLAGQERPALVSTLFVSLIGGLDLLPLLPKAGMALLESGLSLRALAELRLGVDCFAGSIPSPYAFYLWAPHHIAAGVALLVGVLVWMTADGRRRTDDGGLRSAVVLPIVFFAIAGYSVYVAIPVAVALVVFALIDAFAGRRDGRALRRLVGWSAVAAATVLLAWPYLHGLVGTLGAETSGIVLHVPGNGESWADGAVVAALLGDRWPARLLDLPLRLLIDAGGLLVAGVVGWVVWWRRQRASPWEQPEQQVAVVLLLAGGASLVITALFSSRGAAAGLSCNDLRIRGSLPLQLSLAATAGLGVVRLWDRHRRWVRIGLVAILALGVVSVGWTLAERGLVRFAQPPAVSADGLVTYEFIRSQTPADAVFQGDVGQEVHQDRLLHLLADRVSRVESGSYPLLQVPVDLFRPDVQAVVAAFRTRDSAEAWWLLSTLGVDYVFIGPQERQAYGPELPQFGDSERFELIYTGYPYQILRVK
jgi:hypothetical protein